MVKIHLARKGLDAHQ